MLNVEKVKERYIGSRRIASPRKVFFLRCLFSPSRFPLPFRSYPPFRFFLSFSPSFSSSSFFYLFLDPWYIATHRFRVSSQAASIFRVSRNGYEYKVRAKGDARTSPFISSTRISLPFLCRLLAPRGWQDLNGGFLGGKTREEELSNAIVLGSFL